MEPHRKLRPPMPFEPSAEHLKHMPKFKDNNIPRYLFRIHCPDSAGTTTTSCVVPPASDTINPRASLDIFKEPAQQAGDRLWNHLMWKPEHEKTCNFTSWTSSLLFALQYGVYRHQNSRDDRSDLSNICLLILDTQAFPAGTFVKDLEIMRAITSTLDPGENLHSTLDLRQNPKSNGRKYYFGEYLSQGDLALQGKCAQTTMAMLIYLGLFDLQPDLRDKTKRDQWANRVLTLRDPFENLPRIPTLPPTDLELVRKAIVIASVSFDTPLALPAALVLLTLRPRQIKDKVIIKAFAAMFTRDEIRNSLRDCHIDAWRLPEVGQFQHLADAILQEVDELDPLLERMRRLGVHSI